MAVSKFPAPQISHDGKVASQRWGFLRPERDVDLRELGRKLWRRKNVVLGVTAFGTVASVLVLMQMTPQYTARSTVMVDPRQDKVLNMEAVLSGLPADQETIESEIEVLTSRGLAERVVKKLSLFSDPEFNARLRPPTGWEELRAALSPRNLLPEEFLDLIGVARIGPPMTEEQLLENERIATIDQLLDKVDVKRVGRSRVIGVSVKLADPGRAAQVANAIADLYIVEQLEAKFEATKRATEWLNDRLSGLRVEVQRSEQAVEAFRKTSGLVEGKGVTLASQQASELNSQLILSRSKRAGADARLRQVEGLLRRSASADSVAEVLNSPLIQQLRTQEAEVQRRAAELSQEFGEKHPKMINVRAEIADIRTKINGEVNKIVQGLRNEVAVAQARESALRESLQGLEAQVASLNQSEVQLRALEREAKANRSLYENFLSRFKETHEQQEFQKPDARIISHADRPTSPSAPKKGLIAAFAFVLFAALGIAVAFVLESLDKGFRSMEEIEGATGIPALGLVPA